MILLTLSVSLRRSTNRWHFRSPSLCIPPGRGVKKSPKESQPDAPTRWGRGSSFIPCLSNFHMTAEVCLEETFIARTTCIRTCSAYIVARVHHFLPADSCKRCTRTEIQAQADGQPPLKRRNPGPLGRQALHPACLLALGGETHSVSYEGPDTELRHITPPPCSATPLAPCGPLEDSRPPLPAAAATPAPTAPPSTTPLRVGIRRSDDRGKVDEYTTDSKRETCLETAQRRLRERVAPVLEERHRAGACAGGRTDGAKAIGHLETTSFHMSDRSALPRWVARSSCCTGGVPDLFGCGATRSHAGSAQSSVV